MRDDRHSGKILLVDDDGNLVELLKMRLASANYEVVAASTSEAALEVYKTDSCHLAIVDLRLADMDGISLMDRLHSMDPELPVVILTAHGSIETAVDAIKKGAYTYLTKPFDAQELLVQIARAMENRKLNSEVTRLKGLVRERYEISNIVSRSPKMQEVLNVVLRIAPTDSTVCIHGESGTGKEVIAKAIHLASPRKDNSFVAINCAAIPETLLESELFGHDKGAFTGAVRSNKGLFTEAHRGTIFLDEIADMPLAVQAKLLRVLQERQFYPVGSTKPVEVDVRVIVATKRDLEHAVQDGQFREDLFYRIHVIPIHLPPLRERKQDIPYLADYFLEDFRKRMKKDVRGITVEAMKRLMDHDWPGNIRELQHTIEFAVAMAQHDMIEEDLILEPAKISKGTNSLKPFKEAKEEFEKDYLIRSLRTTDGNISRAAKLAGRYRADFYELLKKHSVNVSDFKKPGHKSD
jgi:two-component system response regulator GlrR